MQDLASEFSQIFRGDTPGPSQREGVTPSHTQQLAWCWDQSQNLGPPQLFSPCFKCTRNWVRVSEESHMVDSSVFHTGQRINLWPSRRSGAWYCQNTMCCGMEMSLTHRCRYRCNHLVKVGWCCLTYTCRPAHILYTQFAAEWAAKSNLNLWDVSPLP